MSHALETFFSAWAMQNADERAAAVAASVSADARYSDPRTEAPLIGPDALAEYVAMFSASAPGAVATVAKAEDRDGITRATIAFKMPNGMQQFGQYYAEHDDTGKLRRMVGFVGTGEIA